jgi:hypothetical protein
MNQLSEVTESLNNLSLSNTETKPKRGRPSKPNVKNEEGKYLCKMKYYEENSSEITARNKETQNRYRECYRTLKELVLQYNIEIPPHMKEKINKLICF